MFLETGFPQGMSMPSPGFGTRRMQKSKNCRSDLAKLSPRLSFRATRRIVNISKPKTQKTKSGKCWAYLKSKKSERAYSRTRKPSRSRLTNELKMVLLPSWIMQMVKTTTSNQNRVTLLHGASLPRYLGMTLTQLTKKQRRMAAGYLLEKVSWTDIASQFKIELTAACTRQLCDAVTVSKDLMVNLLLAAGGRGGISSGGSGSNGELTNWDGTKKKTGWGM